MKPILALVLTVALCFAWPDLEAWVNGFDPVWSDTWFVIVLLWMGAGLLLARALGRISDDLDETCEPRIDARHVHNVDAWGDK